MGSGQNKSVQELLNLLHNETAVTLQTLLYGPDGAALLPSAAAAADAVTNPTISKLGAYTYVYNGLTWDRMRNANVFKGVNVAITAGTPATIWTPASGKKFRLMGWTLISTVASVAGMIFKDDTTELWRIEIGRSTAANPIGNGKLSAAANNTLKLDLGDSGTVTGLVWGTEE